MKTKAHKIITIASVAAIYAVFTYLSAVIGLAYGAVQFRLSEALMVFCVFSPEAMWGLVLGCIIGNIASPLGVADILFGAAATLISALLIRLVAPKLKGNFFKCIATAGFTALVNAVVIGAEIVLIMAPESASLSLFFINAVQVAIGELVVCLALSYPLLQLVKNNHVLSDFFNTKRS